jgi:phospholipase C
MERRQFLKLAAGAAGSAALPDTAAAQGALTKINNVVVLMLENRSFDSMLGRLYPKSASFEGLSGTESNLDQAGNRIPVQNRPGTGSAALSIPSPDPGELWTDMNQQIFGKAGVPPPGAVPDMGGFARNYQAQKEQPPYDPSQVMNYFTPDQVPVISKLATEFAVCDHWFAPAPCQTWPNRFFAHTATANGYQNNMPLHVPYTMPTIFERLQKVDSSSGWHVYFHDIPQSLTLANLWYHPTRFRLFNEFLADAKRGSLPKYSFIEPRYFTDIELPNDQHPPHAVTPGEQLMADVYNALRASPTWTSTLFVITYDEHGGCFDHVHPPAAAPPSTSPTEPFNFDRYGVRVPTVVISPFVKKGTILRSQTSTPYDHTSIISSLRKRWSLGDALTGRDAVSPDLDAALSLSEPTNLGPERAEALPYNQSPGLLAGARAAPLNDLQKSLLDLSANLPPSAREVTPHLSVLRAAPPIADTANRTNAEAVNAIKRRLDAFLGSA